MRKNILRNLVAFTGAVAMAGCLGSAPTDDTPVNDKQPTSQVTSGHTLVAAAAGAAQSTDPNQQPPSSGNPPSTSGGSFLDTTNHHVGSPEGPLP